jgi:histidinol dehydrogenase
MSVQELTREGLMALAPTVRTLAQLEGLDAHAQAVAVRLDDLSDDTNRADIEADRTGT